MIHVLKIKTILRFVIYSLVFLFAINIVYSQNFEFKWEIIPSHFKTYSVKIEQRDTIRFINIIKDQLNDNVFMQISQSDCNMLLNFLKTYDFPMKGSTIIHSVEKIFVDTKLLPDTNWLFVEGDSIRRELLWMRNYFYDKNSNKCYQERYKISESTDPKFYRGEFFTNGETKCFCVFSGSITTTDFELNKMIYKLIKKYDKHNNYKNLRETIELDKPKKKKGI